MSINYKEKTLANEKHSDNIHVNNREEIQAKLVPKCNICGRPAPAGLYDGLRLAGNFICSRCEYDIISADTTDPFYNDRVVSIRKILFGS